MDTTNNTEKQVEDYNTSQNKEKKLILDLQKEIGKCISNEPKTEDDLLKLIPNSNYDLLTKALKNMLILKLVKKDGFPVKYSLSDEIANKLNQRREKAGTDNNSIRANILIESKSDNKGTLRKATEEISARLKADTQYMVYDLEVADIIVDNDLFSTYISAEISCPNLSELLRLVYYYGVTSIDVIKPEKLSIPISDLQQSLFTLIDMTHGYAEMIYKLQNKVKDLENIIRKK